ncbi:MAG: peptidase S8 [Bacteroidetes bacterium]|nr:MAG: peptidase S8 [Bacteroidota bacterium]
MTHRFRTFLAFPLMLALAFTGLAQEAPLRGWHHKDPSEGVPGVGTEKAYELLKGRKPTKVIVAILDSGVDTDHEDLKDNIWVNRDEIPGNGIDDDKNGYVDDINGWNFLGNAAGVNLDGANLEITRLYRKLAPKFSEVESVKSVAKADRADYELFKKAEKTVLEELNGAAKEFGQIDAFVMVYRLADSTATAQLGTDYSADDVLGWTPEEDDAKLYQGMLAGLVQDESFSYEALMEYHKYLKDKLEYHYNPRFVDRSLLGDDYENTSERFYGNNDVSAPHDDHGTHVSGIVGAVRNNDLGMNGICANVELMILRTVPNGDEFDKDVANAIRYAADNGAHIMNMSFGKAYSPQKEAVYEAIRYAEEKGVLMVHGAGNDAENIDKEPNFPNPYYPFQKQPCSTWLSVGASGPTDDDQLVGVFSNYGKKRLDIFAPGVQIYSAKPNDTYEFADGTSMAAPVVSGVAALIKSYFPEITGQQLRDLLLESATDLSKRKVLLPDPNYEQSKTTKFGKLSKTGGVVNAANAVQLALTKYSK